MEKILRNSWAFATAAAEKFVCVLKRNLSHSQLPSSSSRHSTESTPQLEYRWRSRAAESSYRDSEQTTHFGLHFFLLNFSPPLSTFHSSQAHNAAAMACQSGSRVRYPPTSSSHSSSDLLGPVSTFRRVNIYNERKFSSAFLSSPTKKKSSSLPFSRSRDSLWDFSLLRASYSRLRRIEWVLELAKHSHKGWLCNVG